MTVSERRRARSCGDAGIGLVELLITMVIASILLTVMATMFTSSLRQTKTAMGRTTSAADSRIAVEALSRDLRVAVAPTETTAALISATPRGLSFYASKGTTSATADPNPVRVEYTVDATQRCLRRAQTKAVVATDGSLSWPVTPTSTVCVARGDFNADASALFTYYPLITTAAPNPAALAPGASGLTGTQLAQVAGVKLTLRVGATAYPQVPPTVVQQFVTLTNQMAKLQKALATP